MIQTVPEKMCSAEVNDWDDAGVMPWLTCLSEHYHDGPHRTVCSFPCTVCGGVDLHHDWCAGEEEWYEDGILIIRFDDDGWYWVEDYIQA